MAGDIQVVPQGLLGLLQIKSQGSNPNRLLSEVMPTIDLAEWWRQARIEEVFSLFPGGTLPARLRNTPAPFISFQIGGVDCAVPAGQWWYIDQLSVQLVLPLAADNARFQGAVNTSVLTVPNVWYGITDIVSDVVSARVNRCIQASLSRPFWAPPGTVFGLSVFDAVTAGNLTFSMNLRAVRLPT